MSNQYTIEYKKTYSSSLLAKIGMDADQVMALVTTEQNRDNGSTYQKLCYAVEAKNLATAKRYVAKFIKQNPI